MPETVKPVLGVDVDSTVWDLTGWVCDAVETMTGDCMDPAAITTWSHVWDVYGEEAALRIFKQALEPCRVPERVPYSGAANVLRRLQAECDLHIHFITHNWDPKAMHPYLEPWLREHFGPEVEVTITDKDKLPILQEIGAFGMVDDRPETLERVAEAGLWAATLLQPWNRELVLRRPDIHGFKSWVELPALLPPLNFDA